jgi:hypothetical protein
MKTKVVMRCDNCVFWIRQFGESGKPNQCGYDADGLCFRYPPVANLKAAEETERSTGETCCLENSYHWSRPVTLCQEFCGEFRSIESPLPTDETWNR